MNQRKQKESLEIELEIQKLAELEAREHEALERRWTDDDLMFAWGKGYEARVSEELEQQQQQQQEGRE